MIRQCFCKVELNIKFSHLLLFVALLFINGAAQADVSLSPLFGNHMVLQQGITLPVWGKGAPGEAVTVSIADQKGTAVTGADGKWRVDLKPLAVQHKPQVLVVSSKNNTLKFSDVLVGDVWVCSGQSNMEFGMTMDSKAQDEIPKADYPEIRMFVVPLKCLWQPATDLPPSTDPDSDQCKWVVCTPDNVRLGGSWNGFSAVAYYFATGIYQKNHQPLGLISSSMGGTPAQAWTTLPALQADPGLKRFVDIYDKAFGAAAKLQADYPAAEAAYEKAYAAWENAGGKDFETAMAAWKVQAKAAATNNQPPPPKPVPAIPPPVKPSNGDMDDQVSSSLFNGMINPLIPFGMKGVIWYQGEQNTDIPYDYGELFKCMINDWRSRWAEGDFPFLYVQLANYQDLQKDAVELGGYQFIRDGQFQALSLNNTGMAVAIDVGTAYNIHPPDKWDVGHRLALVGLHVAYGQNFIYSGPIYDSLKVEGSTIRIIFKCADNGLKIGCSPLLANPQIPKTLASFAIAGDDKTFHPALAVIDGNTVVVSNPQVTDPVAVRYGWANNPDTHLYNTEGLPASPFRTDDWLYWNYSTP